MAKQEQRPEDAGLPPELLLLLDAFRREIDARFTSMKLWGGLALVSGGTIGGIISRVVAPTQTQAAYHAVVTFLI